MTPTIAILVGREPEHRYSVHRGYADALWAAGAIPIVVTPPPSAESVRGLAELIEVCDGVLLTGGGDIDPALYGETPQADLMSVDPTRDAAELEVVRAANIVGRPMLGICRGIQLLAVAHGGGLHQDLKLAGFDHHWHEDQQHEPVHDVEAMSDTATAFVLGGRSGRVNSIHHQAVKSVGSLTATAWSTDGVIEAVEADRVLGVQWHPERLYDRDPAHLAPFEWLVKRAS